MENNGHSFDSLSFVNCLNMQITVELGLKENMCLFDFDSNIYPLMTNISLNQIILVGVKLLLVQFIILYSIEFSFKKDGISSSIIHFNPIWVI